MSEIFLNSIEFIEIGYNPILDEVAIQENKSQPNKDNKDLYKNYFMIKREHEPSVEKYLGIINKKDDIIKKINQNHKAEIDNLISRYEQIRLLNEKEKREIMEKIKKENELLVAKYVEIISKNDSKMESSSIKFIMKK